MPSDSRRDRLPFEPRNKKKIDTEASSAKPRAKKITPPNKRVSSRSSRPNSNLSAIPDAVSKRMGLRMAIFCGIPSALGMLSLFVFYWLKTKEIIDLPPYLALAVSLAFLAIGIFGLSYGVFSASWDEERVGSVWGTDEFKVNLGRTRDAWKASKKAKTN